MGFRVVVGRLFEGDGYKTSEIWEIERGSIKRIQFNGLDDLEVLPIENCYGCTIVGTEMTIYLYKKGSQWNQ